MARPSRTGGNELSLSNVVNPLLTFWVRGQLSYYLSFRPQISTNGGVTWMEQSVANLDTGFNSDWTRKQISLLPYTNATLRLRFLVSGDWRAPDEDIFLDAVGIGEAAPSVPFLAGPAMLGTVNILRPTLAVILRMRRRTMRRRGWSDDQPPKSARQSDWLPALSLEENDLLA